MRALLAVVCLAVAMALAVANVNGATTFGSSLLPMLAEFALLAVVVALSSGVRR